jgi:hypothetical protein
MNNRNLTFAAATVLCAASIGFGQIILFNEPTPWITQRSDSLVIKAQVDTAQIKKKDVTVTVSSVVKGKASVIAKKSFKADDLSKDFNLGFAKTSLIGGYDFLRAEWTVSGSKDKGECVPFGIVDLSKLPSPVVYTASKSAGPLSEKSLASLPEASYQSLDGVGCAVVWNESSYGIVCKKSTDAAKCLIFCFDGKNGKNSFLSYPDRIVKYWPAIDSIATIHYERSIKDNTITYAARIWNTEATIAKGASLDAITVPLADVGVIATDNRTIGFAAFSLDKDGKTIKALPEKAQQEIPGTWANLVMGK